MHPCKLYVEQIFLFKSQQRHTHVQKTKDNKRVICSWPDNLQHIMVICNMYYRHILHVYLFSSCTMMMTTTSCWWLLDTFNHCVVYSHIRMDYAEYAIICASFLIKTTFTRVSNDNIQGTNLLGAQQVIKAP